MNTTGIATVSENSSDVTDLEVTITDAAGEWVDSVWLITRAYANPVGEFDPDSFDVNTYAADITTALAANGWRPVGGITVDGETVTFTVERF